MNGKSETPAGAVRAAAAGAFGNRQHASAGHSNSNNGKAESEPVTLKLWSGPAGGPDAEDPLIENPGEICIRASTRGVSAFAYHIGDSGWTFAAGKRKGFLAHGQLATQLGYNILKRYPDEWFLDPVCDGQELQAVLWLIGQGVPLQCRTENSYVFVRLLVPPIELTGR
jgi:hypothetical protein